HQFEQLALLRERRIPDRGRLQAVAQRLVVELQGPARTRPPVGPVPVGEQGLDVHRRRSCRIGRELARTVRLPPHGALHALTCGGSWVVAGPTTALAAALAGARLPPRPALVVSAHAGVTDALLDLAARAAAGDADVRAIEHRHRTVLAELSLPMDLLDPLLAE